MPEGGDSTRRRMKVSRRVAGPTPSDGNAAGALLVALAALEAWLGEPNPSYRAMLRRSLARLAEDGGGTRLDLSLDAGQGLLGIALSVRVGGARAGDRRPGLQRQVPLRLQSVDHPAGSLSGDLAPGLIELCARLTELLLDRAVVRANMKRADDRLAALDSAVRGIAGVPSVEDVLEQIAGHVRDLVGSEYAALGIADEAGQLTQFITVGVDDARRAQIGSLPQGHGLLGVIIGDGRTVRIPDIRRGVAHLGAMPIDGHVVRITVSAGVATFGGMGVPWADLLRAADAALLAAKRGGRDQTMRSTALWPATDPSVPQP